MEPTALRYNVFQVNCPTRALLDRIGDKWTSLVIVVLEGRVMRFSELAREIEGISVKMLTQTVRALERDGLVARTVYASVPLRVEYALTPLGETLILPLRAIKLWAESYMDEVDRARLAFDRREERVAN